MRSYRHPAKQSRVDGLKTPELLEHLNQWFNLTVINLNYDLVADGASIDWFDGFTECVVNFQRFDPVNWNQQKAGRNIMLHLHGSVLWGYGPLGLHGFEAAKFAEPFEAREALQRGSARRDTVNGQWYGFTPIISGLHKGGRFIYNARPYGYYFQECANALVRNSCLLIIGYSFRDQHLNE